MKKQKKQAFTLVELIVVITILAILGTIAFISLQGYSTSARDSTRIADISSMKTSLELFNLESGKYPVPTSGVDITYSGAVVWTQGTFGDSVYKNVSKLDRLPIDPATNKEYTYSVTSSKFEYQLGGIFEGDQVVMNTPPLTPPYQGGGLAQQTNAGETVATAYTLGSYNGQMTKSLSGTTCSVLAVPSIITNDTSVTNLSQIITNNSFVYRGYKNLPSSFKTSKFKFDGGFTFVPNNLVVYSDTGSCSELTSKTSYTARVNLLKGLQNSYTGTLLKNEGEIRNVLALNIDTNSPSSEVVNYAGNFVNNNLGGNVSTDNTITSNPGIQHLTSITSLASIPSANKATFTYVSSSITGNALNLFDNSLTNSPYGAYWYLGTYYVEIDVQNDFRIWTMVGNTNPYYSYDATLKFINSNTLAEVPNTQSDKGRSNDSQFHIASSTIPAGKYKIYTQPNSTFSVTGYHRLDDEWFIEKMN